MPNLPIFITVLAFTSLSLNSQPLQPEQEQPNAPTAIELPSEGFDPLEMEVVSEEFDGFEKEELVLKSSNYAIHCKLLNNWNQKKPTPKHCSIQFQYRYAPEVTIEFAVFNKSRLSANWDDSICPRILGGIFVKHQDQEPIIYTQSNTMRPNGFYGNIFDNPSFFVSYEFFNEQLKTRILKQQYMILYQKKVILVALVGPPEQAKSLKKTLDQLVYNMFVSLG